MLRLAAAFVAGLATAGSPCVLPLLPVILSGSAGGPLRPWGVVAGFTSVFTLITLFLSVIVRASGLDPSLVRLLAGVFMTAAGLIMAVPFLLEKWEMVTMRFVPRTGGAGDAAVRGSGFVSGLVLGAGLGLVWTPCVGPLMASVISLAVAGAVDGFSALVMFSYSLGTASVMVLVMLGGRGLLKKTGVFGSPVLGRIAGILLILAGVGIMTGFDRTIQVFLLDLFPAWGEALSG